MSLRLRCRCHFVLDWRQFKFIEIARGWSFVIVVIAVSSVRMIFLAIELIIVSSWRMLIIFFEVLVFAGVVVRIVGFLIFRHGDIK